MKFLLLTIIIGYVIIKAIGIFFRLIIGGSTMNQYGQQQQQQQRPTNGNVHVDYVPKNDKKTKENFKGGEYVDFEEVK